MRKTDFESFRQRVYEIAGIDSQTKLAKLLNVHRSAVSQAKRRNSVPENWILRLSDMFQLDPNWVDNDSWEVSGKKDESAIVIGDVVFRRIRKVKARLCAGAGSFETEETPVEYKLFSRQWLRKKGIPDQMVLMDVFGDTMEPEIKNGDTILVDQSANSILAGSVYAVGIDDTIMVKRVEKRPGKLVLFSDNQKYAPIILEGVEMEGVRIIGRVVWISRELF